CEVLPDIDPKAMPADGMTAASRWEFGTFPGSFQIRLRRFRYTGNNHVSIGKERYVRSAGHLMPLHTDQPLPGLARTQAERCSARDFCPNHLSRLSYVVESSTNTGRGRPPAPPGSRNAGPDQRPERPLRDRDIQEQPAPRGTAAGSVRAPPKVL